MESKWIQIVNEFGLTHNHNRKFYIPESDLPEYCLIYKIEFLNLKSEEKGVIWISNLKELEKFLKYELPINFLRKFMEFPSNISESGIATDLEYFFVDESFCKEKLSDYQKGISEMILNSAFESINILLANSFNNSNGWFSSIPQIKWLGKTNMLFQTTDIEVKAFLHLFDAFKVENDKIAMDINDFNIYNTMQKSFTDFDVLLNHSLVEMRGILAKYTFDETENVRHNFRSYFNSSKASLELIDDIAKEITSNELKNAARNKIEEYKVKFIALELEFFKSNEK